MILGTAGLTSLMSAFAIQARESILLGEKVNDVLVTGATGGVGSVAIMALTKLGYNVTAVSGKESRMLVAVLVYLSTLLPVWAEDVVAGFSQDSISITTNFSGSEILIFGAVRREAPIARDTDLEVVVTVAGRS